MPEVNSHPIHRLTDIVQPQYPSDQEEAHLREYWKMVVKHCRLVLLVFLAVVSFTLYRNFSATPLYTASTILRIEPQNPTVMKIDEVLSPQAVEYSQYDYYQTQFALLKSRILAARVITEMGLELNPAFTGVRASSPGLLDWSRSQLSRLLHEEGSSQASQEEFPQISEPELGISSRLIDRYLNFLEVVPIRSTRLVRVLFTSPDPRLSRDMTNAHAVAFIRMNLEDRFELTTEAREFLEKKLSELKDKIEQSEAALNRFRRTQGVFSLQGSENIIVERMVDLNKRLTDARAKRIEIESLYRAVDNKNPQFLSQVINNTLIQGLKNQLATLEAEQARLSTTFTPEHPSLIELAKQINEARQQLDREITNIVRGIEADYAAARAQEESLQAEAERQQQAALNLKEQGVEYPILEAAVESNHALYDSVLKRADETHVSSGVAVSNIRITDRAEIPLAPSSPQTLRNLFLAAVCSLLFGVGFAFFLEYLDATIKTPQDVWRAAAVPTLGIVPHFSSLRHRAYGYGHLLKHSSPPQLGHPQGEAEHSSPRELMSAYHPLSVISESYRIIRTALLLSQAERPPQMILFTSAHPGEGKTMTALNVAIALAQNGYSVVVVDADLRKGCCHKLLNRSNSNGLTDLLTNGSLTVLECVQQTAVDGLFLLPRGRIPPSPADLIGSHKMQEVLGTLRQNFAFVLVDSTPLISVSDAIVLSTLCDRVLMVVQGSKTTVAIVRQAVGHLKDVHAQILGVVLNGINIRSPDYASYRYYYTSYYATNKESDVMQT